MLLPAFGKKARAGLVALVKTRRMARFTLILYAVGLLAVLPAGAQTVTLTVRNIPLDSFFAKIEQQTPYRFVFTSEDLQGTSRVSISVKQAMVPAVLDLAFKDQPLSYRLEDHLVLVRQKGPPSGEPLQTLNVIHGKVLNEKGEPLVGATVAIKGTNTGTSTNEAGEFTLDNVPYEGTLAITHIGYEKIEQKIKRKTEFLIKMTVSANKLSDVEVTLSTGYQTVSPEKPTGSFVQVDNALINRSVSTDILSRLTGVTNGLIFNTNIVTGTNQSNITIDGRSTIFSNPNPLIVVDNFKYDGDLLSINPNDIESITVLKDAAAASIWGSYSGNGVIVITTKKGHYNQPLKVSVNTNVTIGDKPNLYYNPILSSTDYINVEQYLYQNGQYTGYANYRAETPVVDILNQQSNGLISPAQAASEIDALREQDVRTDLSKYFYQRNVNQQYAINMMGGGTSNKYFLSAGFDNNRQSLVRNGYSRITLTGNNTFSCLQQRLEITSNIAFTQSNTGNNNNGTPGIFYPYAKLADSKGNPLAVPEYLDQGYIDTAGQGYLLDWNARPLQDLLLADNTTQLTELRVNTSIKYKIIRGLDVNLLYQYSKGISQNQNFQSDSMSYTRNLINSYTQIDFADGNVTTPIPIGGILDNETSSYFSNDGRAQLNYSNKWGGRHDLSAIAGTEVTNLETEQRSYRLYGYDQDLQTSGLADYVDFFPMYYKSSIQLQIPENITNVQTINRFFSYYGNAAYTYNSRYTISGSARRDESNIFGVNANQKGVPLWSTGGAWRISDEKFYHLAALPFLRLRATDGYNGNVNTSVSAYTTASIGGPNPYGALQGSIDNPPNPSLQWEKIHIQNFGLDFGTLHNRIAGSLEFYIKNGENLIGQSPIDPTTGVTSFTGNTADMKGHGADVQINTRNTTGRIKWYSSIIINYTMSKVTEYAVQPPTIGSYLTSSTINPLVGKPLYSIYSFRWAGLDSAGNPQGYSNGKVTENYSSIINSTSPSDLKYNGPATPTLFGSFRNTMAWNQFSLSLNITYKFGYYFRRPSIDYYALFYSGTNLGSPDYDRRWLNPGDEKHTNVPSMIYPANAVRDELYDGSEILVDKAGNIRLQDVQLSYDLTKKQITSLPVEDIQFYFYANNIGLLWRANKNGIDPDFIPASTYPLVYPNPRTFALGARVNF
jgi:TonB-linked SusC/RagA family outer membrane protein